MNTMKWLVKREFWEHKGGFYWTPAVIGAIMTFILALTVFGAAYYGGKHGMQINGAQVTSLSRVMDANDRAEMVAAIATGYMGTAAPLFMAMAFVVFFFCLGALFDERKDRSVLFWKSLPVSDWETVLSKVATALVIAPLITLAFATITGVLNLLIICTAAAMSGVNVFGAVLSSSATYLAPFQLASIIPVYIVWALPTVGWLMMVGAWARTKPFLWAVGVPCLIGALSSWFNAMFDFGWSIEWFWQHIVARGLLSVAPGSWFAFTPVTPEVSYLQHNADNMILVGESWRTLGTANAWIGAAIGSAMVFAAIRLRRWKDEG
jgi:ABC-2 type transport system permease protein